MLFLVEGLPATLLGISILYVLADGPKDVDWLSASEKVLLSRDLEAERARVEILGRSAGRSVITSPIVLMLGLIYLGNGGGLFGISAWLPMLTHDLGFTYWKTGLIISSIYLLMAAVMILWTNHAARTREYLWHLAIPSLLGIGFILAGEVAHAPLFAVTLFASALILMSPVTPTFWNLPPQCLSGGAAAVGIAVISAIVALGAFIGPTLVGVMKDRSGSLSTAVLYLVAGPLLAALLTLGLRLHPAFKQSNADASRRARSITPRVAPASSPD